MFGWEYLGMSCGKNGCGFIVSLIRPFSGGSGLSGGDCDRGTVGFGESRRWRR